MGPKTTELVEVLKQLVELLETSDESHWSKILVKSKVRIEDSDFSGVELLLGSYGGMGSFNDLIIHQPTSLGVVKFTKDGVESNEKLSALRTQAWNLAQDIKRDQQ